MIETYFQSAGEQARHQGRPAHPAPITQPASLNSRPLRYPSNKACGPIYSEVRNKTSPNRIDGPDLRQGRTQGALARYAPLRPNSAVRPAQMALNPLLHHINHRNIVQAATTSSRHSGRTTLDLMVGARIAPPRCLTRTHSSSTVLTAALEFRLPTQARAAGQPSASSVLARSRRRPPPLQTS